jgi:hypothetical protein
MASERFLCSLRRLIKVKVNLRLAVELAWLIKTDEEGPESEDADDVDVVSYYYMLIMNRYD